MFIFITDQELRTRELMDHIMSCDHSLDQKYILNFVYCFMIIFFTIYILNIFIVTII
jgi:hypothetical protein